MIDDNNTLLKNYNYMSWLGCFMFIFILSAVVSMETLYSMVLYSLFKR